MTSSKKTFTAGISYFTIFSRTDNQSFLYSLWTGFFPNHQTFFLLSAYAGKFFTSTFYSCLALMIWKHI